MTDESKLQIGVNIVAILCSSVISVVLASSMASKRARREFRQKKLEELFLAAYTFTNKLFTHNMVWLRVMQRQLTYDQGNDLVIKNHDKEDKSFDVMRMLVSIYFRELMPHFERILKRRDSINQIVSDWKISSQKGAPSDFSLGALRDELNSIDADEKGLEDDLMRISKKYQRERGFRAGAAHTVTIGFVPI